MYSKEALLTGLFGYDPTSCVTECRTPIHADNALWMLEQAISNPHVAPTFGHALRPYVVFNRETRKFEYIVGIANADLVAWMSTPTNSQEATIQAKAVRAAICNCFEMLSNDGCDAVQADLLDFRGSFSTQFYPMSSAVKDPILQQKPVVYSLLLNQVAATYSQNGVSYAEFSVSLNTVMTQSFRRHVTEQCVWPDEVPFSLRQHFRYQLGAASNTVFLPVFLERRQSTQT